MNKEIKLGDYVEYTPTVVQSKKYKTFDTYTWGETDKYFATQTGKRAIKWRYMGLDEKGSILLVADRPTDDKLYLHGKDGYVNGPSELNDLCKELYSSPLGQARSINVDDVNRVLGAEPVGQYFSTTCKLIDNPKNLTIGEIISREGEKILRYTETPEAGKSINDYSSNYYWYEGAEYKGSRADEYNLIFRSTSHINIQYWLASSCVYAFFDGGDAYFDVRCVDDGNVNYYCMFNSDGYEDDYGYPVRPVVCLKSNVQFVGKSPQGVWQIS